MGSPDAIPKLTYQKPDGSLFTRVEMEAQTRSVLPKVYWLRITANKDYRLPKQQTFGMTEIILRHWLLDEMIRQNHITGNLLGVNDQSYNDEGEIRQFTQRLTAMIQAGQAIMPKEGEGLDMSNIPQSPPGGFQPPPPPIPPNGQPQMAPPAYAPPPPPGYQAPPQQQTAPQPTFAPPGPPPMPSAPSLPGPPAAPTQTFQPPAQPGYAPPQPPGQPPAPPMAGAPPAQAASTGPGRGRRKKMDTPTQTPGASPVPPMPGQPMMGAPAQPGFPMPSMGAPPVPFPGTASPQQQLSQYPQAPQQQPQEAQAAPQSHSVDLSALQGQIASLQAQVNSLMDTITKEANLTLALSRQLLIANMGLTVVVRAIYQKPGQTDLESFLKELGIQVPQ